MKCKIQFENGGFWFLSGEGVIYVHEEEGLCPTGKTSSITETISGS